MKIRAAAKINLSLRVVGRRADGFHLLDTIMLPVSLYDDIEDAEDSGTLATQAASARGTAFWGAPRAPMTLAVSMDGGRTWPVMRNLETGDGYCMTNNSTDKLNREFSYPSIVQSADGRLHIAYTYFRQRIKYVSVSEDWASAGDRQAA